MSQRQTPITTAIAKGQRDGKPIWEIQTPVEIHDGKIFFYDKNFECYFDITVRQVKGEGAYYYEKTENPSEDHIEIMKMMQFLEPQKRTWTKQELFNQLRLYHHTFEIKKEVKISPFLGRCSEFTRKKIIILHEKDKYKINHEYISQILKDGKY